MATQKFNYLSNKELLNEIHKSKLTFCSLINPDYQKDEFKNYDIIVMGLKEITPSVIETAKQNYINRIIKQKKEILAEMNIRPSEMKIEPIDPDRVKVEDLVFRVITSEHIPIDTTAKPKKKKTTDDEDDAEPELSKVNFEPFKHYIRVGNEWIEVLRSHWKNGKFDPECGRITNKLAMMFMKLVDRYSQKPNWRNYSYLDEMKAQALLQLAQMGLQFDEHRSAVPNPFAYYTATVTNSFTKIVKLEKKNQNVRDDMLEAYGQNPSITRQIDHEHAMKAAEQAETEAKKAQAVQDWG